MAISVLFAGGGTGGHVCPAVAVARSLAQEVGEANVLFLGTGRPVEARILGRARLPHVALPSAPASSLRAIPRAALAQARAFGRAWLAARSFRPDVVLGLGGYASLPGVLAARALGAKVALFEPNATPGRATAFLAPLASEVYVHFQEAASALGGRAFLTGTPLDASSSVDRAVSKADARSALGLPRRGATILIVGGSQGARALNRFVLSALSSHEEGCLGPSGVSVLHVSGAEDEGALRKAYGRAGIVARVVPFLDGMGTAYRAADLAICRAGAATLAEAAVEGLPLLAVPLPTSAMGHQTANARAYEAKGGGKLLEEAALSPQVFEQVLALAQDAPLLAAQSALARAQARPHAARVVASRLVALALGDSKVSREAETADRKDRTHEVASGAPVSTAVASARAA